MSANTLLTSPPAKAALEKSVELNAVGQVPNVTITNATDVRIDRRRLSSSQLSAVLVDFGVQFLIENSDVMNSSLIYHSYVSTVTTAARNGTISTSLKSSGVSTFANISVSSASLTFSAPKVKTISRSFRAPTSHPSMPPRKTRSDYYSLEMILIASGILLVLAAVLALTIYGIVVCARRESCCKGGCGFACLPCCSRALCCRKRMRISSYLWRRAPKVVPKAKSTDEGSEDRKIPDEPRIIVHIQPQPVNIHFIHRDEAIPPMGLAVKEIHTVLPTLFDFPHPSADIETAAIMALSPASEATSDQVKSLSSSRYRHMPTKLDHIQ